MPRTKAQRAPDKLEEGTGRASTPVRTKVKRLESRAEKEDKTKGRKNTTQLSMKDFMNALKSIDTQEVESSLKPVTYLQTKGRAELGAQRLAGKAQRSNSSKQLQQKWEG